MLIGLIKPQDHTKEEKEFYAKVMADNNLIIHKGADERGCSIAKFIRDLGKGCGEFSDEELKAFNSIKEIEGDVLAGNCKLVLSYAKKYIRHYPALKEDIIQEGILGLRNTIYYYDGSTKFSTYCSQGIKRHIVRLIQGDHFLNKPVLRIVKLSLKIQEYQENHDVSFEKAIEALEVNKKDANHCLDLMTKTVHLSDSDESKDPLSSLASYNEKTPIDDSEKMWESLKSTDLSDFERALLTAYLNGDKYYKSRIAEEFGYSRQAGDQGISRAIEKLRKQYHKKAA